MFVYRLLVTFSVLPICLPTRLIVDPLRVSFYRLRCFTDSGSSQQHFYPQDPPAVKTLPTGQHAGAEFITTVYRFVTDSTPFYRLLLCYQLFTDCLPTERRFTDYFDVTGCLPIFYRLQSKI